MGDIFDLAGLLKLVALPGVGTSTDKPRRLSVIGYVRGGGQVDLFLRFYFQSFARWTGIVEEAVIVFTPFLLRKRRPFNRFIPVFFTETPDTMDAVV